MGLTPLESVEVTKVWQFTHNGTKVEIKKGTAKGYRWTANLKKGRSTSSQLSRSYRVNTFVRELVKQLDAGK